MSTIQLIIILFLFPGSRGLSTLKNGDTLNAPNSSTLKSVNSDRILISTEDIKLWHLDDEDTHTSAKRFPARYHLSVHGHRGNDDPTFFYLYDSTDSSGGEKEYASSLMDTFHSLVQLDVSHLSANELKYSFRLILRQIKEVLALLDRECVDYDISLKQILDSSTVLNREVTEICFYIDMLKTLKTLLIRNAIPTEHVVLNQLVELDIFLLYSRLKSVIGADRILDEFLYSSKISLSAYPLLKRVRILDTIETSFKRIYPDYYAFKYRKTKIDCSDKFLTERKTQEVESIRVNMDSRAAPNNLEATLVTVDSTRAAFLNVFDKSAAYWYSNEAILQEIRELTLAAEIVLNRAKARSITALSILALPSKRVGLRASNKLRCRAFRRHLLEGILLEHFKN